MSRETSKSLPHMSARGDFVKYLHGNGIDIGSGDDPLSVPLGNVTTWDTDQGDAQSLVSEHASGGLLLRGLILRESYLAGKFRAISMAPGRGGWAVRMRW